MQGGQQGEVAATIRVQDQGGSLVACIVPSGYLAWRKQWASENGRIARRVGLVVDTPVGERLVDSATALRRLAPFLPCGETSARLVALCALPTDLQHKLAGCDVWKAI